MTDSPLKEKLKSCLKGPFRITGLSIGHRGGRTLRFPEETVESTYTGARSVNSFTMLKSVFIMPLHTSEIISMALRIGLRTNVMLTFCIEWVLVSLSVMSHSPKTEDSCAAIAAAIYTQQPTSSQNQNWPRNAPLLSRPLTLLLPPVHSAVLAILLQLNT